LQIYGEINFKVYPSLPLFSPFCSEKFYVNFLDNAESSAKRRAQEHGSGYSRARLKAKFPNSIF